MRLISLYEYRGAIHCVEEGEDKSEMDEWVKVMKQTPDITDLYYTSVKVRKGNNTKMVWRVLYYFNKED